MRGPIDDPSSRPQDYDRPNRAWACGLEGEGCPCSAGPTSGGRCPKTAECVPIRDGDRWVCNRSTLRGGPCDHETPGGGPTPDGQCCLVKVCRPKRTLRAIRGRWLRGATLFAVGAVLMLLGADSRNELAKPGPLSSHHAQVLAGTATNERCAACHPGANDEAMAWLQTAALGDPHATGTQSQACLACHRELAASGGAPLLAHGLPEGAFDAPNRILPASLLGGGPRGADHGDPVACAVCHQEHHGADHNLSAITDTRCQACHQQQYEGFAEGHPDFGVWPYERRSRIAFNHASHEGEHFVKANRSFDCATCHLRDATGDLTARPHYQEACASCHDDALNKSLEAGVELVALPTIDPDAIDGKLAWPDQAIGDFDGDIPPLMRLLLASDPEASEALALLGADATFFDIDTRDETSVSAGADLLTALRSLLDELQEEGHSALAYRVRTLIGERARPIDEYVARLPVELVDEIQAVWFGKREAPKPFDAVEDRRTGGGWWLDHERLTLGYRPTGHDDPMLRAWIDLAIALPDEHAELRDVVLAEFRRPGAPGGCLECHSLDETPSGLVVNWRGRDRLNEPRAFTRFSHRPHLTQPHLADCTHCHQMQAAASVQVAYESTDPSTTASDFAPLGKSACTTCHRPHAAGDHCTQCHNYHVSPDATRRTARDRSEITKRNAALSPLMTK